MATNARTLDVEAFMQEVTQKNLDVKGPSAGYLYAGYQGPNGWEVIRCANNPWYLVQFRRVATQGNGAGGAIILDIQVPTGCVMEILFAAMQNSGTNAAYINRTDEDNVIAGYYAQVGSAASTICSIPRGYASPTTSNLLTASDNGRLIFGPGEKLTFMQTGAGAQSDTLTAHIVALLSQNVDLVWSVARSTNAANVTLAASTISAANSRQLVPMP